MLGIWVTRASYIRYKLSENMFRGRSGGSLGVSWARCEVHMGSLGGAWENPGVPGHPLGFPRDPLGGPGGVPGRPWRILEGPWRVLGRPWGCLGIPQGHEPSLDASVGTMGALKNMYIFGTHFHGSVSLIL